MVLEQHLGPLRPYIQSAASALSAKLQFLNLTPPSPSYLADALIITVLLVLFSTLTFTLTSLLPRRDNRNAVLILGISGESDAPAVGKTAIFNALRYGSLPKHGTVPSMVVNDATFNPSGTSQSTPPLRWIDFPGHDRLRHTLNSYLAVAKCIVFVIDAQRFTAQARKDAQLLFDVLTNPVVADKATPLLVFCNKSDTAAHAKTIVVQTRLEAELQRVRAANSSSLRSAAVATDGSGNQTALGEEEERVPLGYDGEPFSFDHASGPITFASGSALTNDVEAIINFARSSFL